MSRWADLFAALSRDVDTSDTSRQIGGDGGVDSSMCRDVSRSVRAPAAPEGACDAPAFEPAERNSSESAPPAKAEVDSPATVIAPAQWFAAEPHYGEPCAARRGLLRYRDGHLEHFCAVCGAWGAWGYGVTVERPGRWFCFEHRPPEG